MSRARETSGVYHCGGASAERPMVRRIRLSVLTPVVMVVVGALLWLRGASGEGLVLIAAAVPLARSSRRGDVPAV